MFGKKISTEGRNGKTSRADALFGKAMEEIGLGDEYKERLLLSRWPDIVGSPGYKYIRLVALKNYMLYLNCNDAVWRDMFKFMKADIIDKMNRLAGNFIVKDACFIKKPYKKIMPFMKTDFHGITDDLYYDFAPEMKAEVLSEEELQKVKDSCKNVENEELRNSMERAWIARLKLNKLKERKGFHRCPICHALTEPSDELCAECRRGYKDKTYRKIRQIIEDEPQITYAELNKRVPCPPEIFIHQWARLVQNLIFEADVRDLENQKTKTLAMVYSKCSPEDVAKNDFVVEKALKALRNDIGEAYYEMLRCRKKDKLKKKEEERKHRYDRPKKKR